MRCFLGTTECTPSSGGGWGNSGSGSTMLVHRLSYLHSRIHLSANMKDDELEDDGIISEYALPWNIVEPLSLLPQPPPLLGVHSVVLSCLCPLPFVLCPLPLPFIFAFVPCLCLCLSHSCLLPWPFAFSLAFW